MDPFSGNGHKLKLSQFASVNLIVIKYVNSEQRHELRGRYMMVEAEVKGNDYW